MMIVSIAKIAGRKWNGRNVGVVAVKVGEDGKTYNLKTRSGILQMILLSAMSAKGKVVCGYVLIKTVVRYYC